MTVEFVCEQCDQDVLVNLDEQKKVSCPKCQKEYQLTLGENLNKANHLNQCQVCGREHLYVQKDFNPRLGILIFVIGVLLSYHTYFISLAVATLIDFVLYKVLNTVTICYHCRTVHRGFKEDPDHKGFDHELAMKLVVQEEREQKASEQEKVAEYK